MEYIFIILAFSVSARANIIYGTGEECNGFTCGYGAYCNIQNQQCDCSPGFDTEMTGNVAYCLKICDKDDDCLPGYTCVVNQLGAGRCDCATGYIRSSLDECARKPTSTVQPKTTDTPTTGTSTTTGQGDTSVTTTTVPSDIEHVSVTSKSTLTARRQENTSVTPTADSLPLYIGLGVGIASFILLVIILVILIVVIRRRRQNKKGPVVTNEEGTVINNNLNINVRGAGSNQCSESPVDLSDETQEKPKEKTQNTPTVLTARPRVTHGLSTAYEEVDIDSIKVQDERFGANLNSPKKFDNSDTKSKGKTGLKNKPAVQELYSNHKIPKNKAKGKGVEISKMETPTRIEDEPGKSSQLAPANGTQIIEHDTLNTNPYNTLYDLKQSGPVVEDETSELRKVNECPYSLAKPIGDAISPKLEEQTTISDRNDYDELKLQILANKNN